MDDKSTPRQNKGKGKAPEESAQKAGMDAGQAKHATADRPLVSRITASASNLTGALFSGPLSPKALSSWNNNEKGGSSAPRHVASELAEACNRTLSVAGPQGSRPVAGHAPEHIAEQEARFAAFLDSDSVSVPSTLDTLEQTRQAVPSRSTSLTMDQQVMPASSVREQEDRDGRDAVALLSAYDEDAPNLDFVQGSISTDTPELRRALFGTDAAGSMASEKWDDLLNFVPDYLRVAHSGRYTADTLSDSARAEEAVGHLGTADIGTGWQIWLNQWSDVLAQYQDAVWGDLASLVKEARAEVEGLVDIRVDEKPNGPTALLRLQHILGHLRAL